MTEVSRPRGRPPKVRPEANQTFSVAGAIDFTPTALPGAGKTVEAPLLTLAQPAGPRMIEVELLRKYAPEGQPQEIKQVVHPGTVTTLPVLEATRALKLGIARATDRTFAS